ncbi:MAG TPA: alpha/beta fold hydrolase [Kofleriaceae bacterium]|jgi:haloalkane dehalogenase
MLPPFIASQLPEGARSSMLDVGGGERMHIFEWGATAPTAPTVLFVHGNPTWSFLWRKVVAALRETARGRELRLVVPDLIGLGLSTKPAAAAHSLERHIGWLGSAIDGLALGPLVLVGQDWGGPIGLGAMSERLGRLRAIVFGNTVVGPPSATFKPSWFHRFARAPVIATLAFRGMSFPLHHMHLSQGDRSSIRGDVARAYRWPLRKLADRAAPLALARMVPDSATDHPSIPALRRTEHAYRTAEVPVRLVWGMKDPILGRVVGHMQRLRPDAKVVKTGAGHFLQEEVPDELAAAVLDVV